MNVLFSETNYLRRAQKDGSHLTKSGHLCVDIDTSACYVISLYNLNLCTWERKIFTNELGS